MEDNSFLVNTKVIQGEMNYNGETLLTYRIEFPELTGDLAGESVIIFNNCQKEKALEYQRYCENTLYPMALENYRNSIRNNYPIRIYEALVIYKVTYNKNMVISLYYDIYEYTAGAHGSTLRCADTCDLKNGRSILLNQLIICPADYKSFLLNRIAEEIRKDPSIYFEDYKNLIVKNFNEDSFYCKQVGIIIFYQQYDIAPYASGIREFLVPYSACVFEPST
ncbi:MAG: DUF3298 and DUF4163 domain-containing protein [Clostridiales bacterium]|nr:DUF3298 and DUF4163 domain-containing protein [Clostridiales bacterium]